MIRGRRRSVIFFTVFGICLVAIAVALNVSWIVLNWKLGILAILGVILFGLIIAGMVLNTIFLVREIRQNEQKDSFLNAVTHELKTPVASIRLYLQTLQTRELDAEKRQRFYRIMLEDSDRLIHTIEQVLRAGAHRSRFSPRGHDIASISKKSRASASSSRGRVFTSTEAVAVVREPRRTASVVLGNVEELKAAVWNLLDNAVSIRHPTFASASNSKSSPSVASQSVSSITGIGIASTELKRIFRRFYRTPALGAVRTKGSGLGLFIVRSVAKQPRRPGVRGKRRHRPRQQDDDSAPESARI